MAARDLLDVAVSWPGIHIGEAAEELGIKSKTASAYASKLRAAGLLHSGPVAVGTRSPAMANDVQGKIWQAVRAQVEGGKPSTPSAVARVSGYSLAVVYKAFLTLRAIDALSPAAAVYPTPAGFALALLEVAA